MTRICRTQKRCLFDYSISQETISAKYFNVQDDKNVPDFVINHKNLEQADFLKLLESASVYVGLGLPVEGPAALESAASGVIFLNPLFRPPRPVAKNKPTTRKLTSQNPYAENVLGRDTCISIEASWRVHYVLKEPVFFHACCYPTRAGV